MSNEETIITPPAGRAVGIDLGTTNSVVAYINANNQPEVIPSSEGPRTIPSVVAVLDDISSVVGKPAVDQEAFNAVNTVRSVKRSMGTAKRYELAGRTFSPEELSAMILKKIKTDAEAFLGEDVTQAVITVPAYFSDAQRQSTIIAGQLAGLEVLRIINEPTAASLAYGLDRKKDETVLVYDLGGGTFDVTVLHILSEDGLFEVKATAGDTRLGGDDFDQVLIDILVAALGEHYDVIISTAATSGPMKRDGQVRNLPQLYITDAEMAALRVAAEDAKKALTASDKTNVFIPYLGLAGGKPATLRHTIYREDFENAIEPLIERTRVSVFQALKDARLKAADIDEVVFVGGSTRVPAVAHAVETWLGKKPNRSINPDEAVAIGAAVQAGILSGQSDRDVLLLDVTPLTLGIETLGGVMTKMIHRNTTIPAEHMEEFSTAEDGQKMVNVRVYQGERDQAKHNILLGDFHLEGIPVAPRGVPKIEVTFAVDRNGILHVTALEAATGVAQTVTCTGSTSLSQEDIAKILTDAEESKEEDAKFLAIRAERDKCADKLVQVRELIRQASALPDETVDDLRDLIDSLLGAETSENLNLLSQLSLGAQETINAAQTYLYQRAAEQTKLGSQSSEGATQ